MEYGIVQLTIAVAVAIGGAVGFIEMRIAKMYQQIKEKMEDKEEINKVIQQSLKEDIARLETKIDVLLQLNNTARSAH